MEGQNTKIESNSKAIEVSAKLKATLMTKISKPTDSQTLVDELNKCLVKLMNQGKINHTHLVAVIQGGKTYSFDSVDDFERVMQMNISKAKKSNEQYGESASIVEMQGLAPLIKEFIIALSDADRKLMRVGTIARTAVFSESLTEVIASRDLAVPHAKKLFMGSFIYNIMGFNTALSLMKQRWSLVKLVFRFIVSSGEMVKAGSISGGKFVASSYYRLKDPSSFLGDGSEPPFVADDGQKFPSIMMVDKSNFLQALSACMAIDARFLLQTSAFKQAKARKDFNRRDSMSTIIASLQLGVITTVNDKYTTDDYDLDHQSKFQQDYFAHYAVIKTTLRTANRDIYGAKGGANTRAGNTSVKGNVVAAF